VGASSLYIQLPFLMEALVAAVLGVALAAGALALFTWVVIYRTLRPSSNIVAWIDWGNSVTAIGWIALIGLALTLLPTLLLTRKYLKV
jgi:cell division transport system permease protein